MSFEQTNPTDNSDQQPYVGRGQSDWAGSGVVIYRKEDRGRKQDPQTTMPGGLGNMEDGNDD